MDAYSQGDPYRNQVKIFSEKVQVLIHIAVIVDMQPQSSIYVWNQNIFLLVLQLQLNFPSIVSSQTDTLLGEICCYCWRSTTPYHTLCAQMVQYIVFTNSPLLTRKNNKAESTTHSNVYKNMQLSHAQVHILFTVNSIML